jgi:hypothetical protein
MRRLLNKLANWWYCHSPARIPELVERTEVLVPLCRVREIETRLAAMEAQTDERRARELARLVLAIPEARKVLDLMFGPEPSVPTEEDMVAAEQAIRRQFPNVPANVEDWDRWPA